MSGWEGLVANYRVREDVPLELRVATLAQWALESGRGASVLAREHNNYGGLKYRARMVGRAEPVDYRGSDGELTTYCRFASRQAFIDGYWHFIASGPYDGWNDFAGDGAGYIRHLQRSGYAADPHYVEKVLALFGEARAQLRGDEVGPPVGEAETRVLARLAVVVGHNAVARGAHAGDPLARSEFPFNSEVARLMRAQAAEFNLEAEVFFREAGGGYSTEIANAYAKVAAWGPTCVLELHFNSASPAASGSEVLHRSGDPAANALAGDVLAEILATLRLPSRGLKVTARTDRGGASLYALPGTPSLLCEPFFGSNPGDCQRVATVGQEGLASAYLRAVRDWAVARAAPVAGHSIAATEPVVMDAADI